MFLALGVREDCDLRSAGPHFCLVADGLADISFVDAFEKMQLFKTKNIMVDGYNSHIVIVSTEIIMEFFNNLCHNL